MKLCWKEVIAVNMFSTVYFSNNKHPNHKRFFLHFFFKFMYLFLEANCFTILYWFSHTLTWICHGCTCVPHPEPSSHLPPHPIPQGCPSALALRALFHTSNLDWWSISHMVIDMFQCYSLKSSHPRLHPQSPKVCSLYLCLFCCLTYRVIIHLSEFHICALIHCTGVFLSDLLHSV